MYSPALHPRDDWTDQLGSSQTEQVSHDSRDQTNDEGLQEDDPDHMGFPETDGPENPDLPLSLIHRGHHIGENDQPANEENNDRYPEGKLLKMV